MIDEHGNISFANNQFYKSHPNFHGKIHAIFLDSQFPGLTILDDPFTTQEKTLIKNIITLAREFLLKFPKTSEDDKKIIERNLLMINENVYKKEFIQNPPRYITDSSHSMAPTTKDFFKQLKFTPPSNENKEWKVELSSTEPLYPVLNQNSSTSSSYPYISLYLPRK